MKLSRSIWLRHVLTLLVLVIALGMPFIPPASVVGQTESTMIVYGTSVFGTVSSSAPQVTYTFNGTPGDLVTVDVMALSVGLDPALDLMGPDAQSLASSVFDRLAAHTLNAHIAHALPQGGTYTLAVSGKGGTTGDFVLRLQGRSVVSSIALQYDTPVDVTVPQGAPSQYFTFTVGDCPTTLTVTNKADGQPFTFPFVVKLRNEDGQDVALLVGGDAQADSITVAALSGSYEVETLSSDPIVSGLITLLVTCASTAPGCDVGGTGSPTGPVCSPCLGCPSDGGETPGCPAMQLAATVFAPEVRGTRLTWNPVPGVDHYLIHIYGLRDDDEHYLGPAGAPGSATDYVFDHLWPGFYGYRFVIEAILGDEVICVDETTTLFPDTEPLCPPFAVTGRITDAAEGWVQWTWDALEDVDGYRQELYAIMDDGSELLLGAVTSGPELTAWDTLLPPGVVPTNMFLVRVWLIVDDAVICPAEATITFLRPPEQRVLPVCDDFSAAVTSHDGTAVTFEWSPYLGAERFIFYIMDAIGALVPGHPVLLSPTQTRVTVDWLEPGTYTFAVGPWVAPDGAFCIREVVVVIEEESETGPAVPCEISTDRSDTRVHVGPGRSRGVFAFLTPGQRYLVIGQARDDAGNVWWQIDKTAIPGHEAVTSLWVAESDVTESGFCEQIPQADVPPVIPGVPDQPPGGWGACGSCDTCGHPGECVTSPDGQCLWDPATCGGGGPPSDGGGPGACYSISAAIDMGQCSEGGSAMIDTVPNCDGGRYLAGTLIQAHAVAVNPKCTVSYWSGCGVSGGGDSISFTAASSCTVTAHMSY